MIVNVSLVFSGSFHLITAKNIVQAHSLLLVISQKESETNDCMNQYFLKKDCKELLAFPHIIEFALKKISTIQFGSLKKETADFFRFYYVIDGRFDWVIDEKHYVLYPGDLAIILPGQSFGGEKDLLDIGTISWIHLK